MTIEGETKDAHGGDVVAAIRVLHRNLYSEGDVTFMESVAAVFLDYDPDKTADLVLGEAGGMQDVAAR